STLLVISSLARPEFLVEVEAIAPKAPAPKNPAKRQSTRRAGKAKRRARRWHLIHRDVPVMLKLCGMVSSINVQKVLWALAELKVPYERTDAGLQFGVVNEPFYRKMNPNGRVPTIEDDGLVLWESNAVVRYLAAKHGAGSLWPDDLSQRADADRWMDWATSTVAPAITPVFWGL